MVMVAFPILQAWIWVGVDIGKFLIVVGDRNILDTKITWSGSLVGSGWLSVSLYYCNRLNVVMD
jgi:hypothetical protein